MSALINVLKLIWSNVVIRWILLVVVIVLLGWFALHSYGKKRYEQGVEFQTTVYEKQQQELKAEYQKRLDAANVEREALNAEITKQKEEYSRLQSQRQIKSGKIQTEVNKYAQSDNGNSVCLDPNWMRIYKDSLPE